MMRILAILGQKAYTRACFRQLLIMQYHRTSGPDCFRDILEKELWVANEELGEQSLSLLARMIASSSLRHDLDSVNRLFLSSAPLAELIPEDGSNSRGFIESRKSRSTFTKESPEVIKASGFLKEMIRTLGTGRFKVYKPACYPSKEAGDAHKIMTKPVLVSTHVMETIKSWVTTEVDKKSYCGRWVKKFFLQLPLDIQAFLNKCRESVVPDVEDGQDEGGEDASEDIESDASEGQDELPEDIGD